MPKTSANLDNFLQASYYNVGLTRQFRNVQSVTVSERPDQLSDDQFRAGVFASHPCHQPTSAFASQSIHVGQSINIRRNRWKVIPNTHSIRANPTIILKHWSGSQAQRHRNAAPVLDLKFRILLLTPVVPANNRKGCAGPVPKFCNLLSCSEN